MPELLTAVVFAPTVGAILLCFIPAQQNTNLKLGALTATLMTFVISLGLWFGFEPNNTGYQFQVQHDWIKTLGITYHVGLDGISFLLVILTTFLTPLTLLGSWTAVEKRVKEFVISILILQTGMLGAFVALDLFLFYVFWEVMLVPMYFLIGIWGGQRRLYAAIKFFIFTMAGSLLMLVAIVYVAWQTDGSWNFALEAALSRSFEPEKAKYLFYAFSLAFLIKVPLFPVHTWLPDAHTEAPTAGSVILAGVLLKLGVYGLIRFAFPMFPGAAMEAAPVIATLSVVGIIYGALAAWVQHDMKKLVAYSSVSHLGFCVLGLCALTVEGVTGSVYQMLAHGMSTGALFLLVGVLYERRHTRMLADYGGIAKKAPVFAFFLVFVVLASAGMPALCGFPGEFLILLGTFTGTAPLDVGLPFGWFEGSLKAHHALAILAATGVILAAVYLLFMVQKVLFGPLVHKANESLTDMNAREIFVIGTFAVVILVMGVRPGVFLEKIEPTTKKFVISMQQKNEAMATADPGQRRPGWDKSQKKATPEPALRLFQRPRILPNPIRRLGKRYPAGMPTNLDSQKPVRVNELPRIRRQGEE
ncbi:MAG: NADH-quinone oxidoreductase subunit M [Myxococcota bacterium]|nr:NADH-quinone oxidoreductase subunit M [Myxococcota bacterium]